MFVPIWYGLTRPDVTSLLLLVENTEEVLVQLELMSMITSQHMPFTLMGGWTVPFGVWCNTYR